MSIVDGLSDFTKMFKGKEEPAVFILVKESGEGIQTYINPEINKFPTPYKKQIVSFLNECVAELNKK